jgi:repressor LexA
LYHPQCGLIKALWNDNNGSFHFYFPSYGFLTIATELARGRVFALKVKGDSMIDAGILDGDYVVVRCQSTGQNGEVVCALMNGEATLKTFYKKGNTVTLKPANRNYTPIVLAERDLSELRILGKVVALMRKF